VNGRGNAASVLWSRTQDGCVVTRVQPPQRAVQARRLAEVVRRRSLLQGGYVGHPLVTLLRYRQLPPLRPVNQVSAYVCWLQGAMAMYHMHDVL
jgi:hypothetical protein